MFVNFTNHPSQYWGKEQKKASLQYGKIIDIPFPNIDPHASTEEIQREAQKYAAEIIEKHPKFVLCQGEFCMTFHVVKILKEKGILAGAACSERQVEEYQTAEGVEKKVIYSFVQYREY